MIESYAFENIPSVTDKNRYRLTLVLLSDDKLSRIQSEMFAIGIKLGIPMKTSQDKPIYELFVYELNEEKKQSLIKLLDGYKEIVAKKEPKPLVVPFLKLNPLFTFDKFVVGENSRFAYSAAIAVSQNPGKVYNPLFIHGGVGLGKTHLIQAIGHKVSEDFPNLVVYYTSARDFMEEVVNAIASGTVSELRYKYKTIDLLLIDDVQFLAGSEATQEEFFHIFNELHLAQKQIVLTSDRPPKLLTVLEDRIRSRFEWGLIADIKVPSLETRVAILKKKSEYENLTIDDELLLHVAKALKSNVRELEGFVRKVQAYAALTQMEINFSTVEQILKELLPAEEVVEAPKGVKTYVSPTKPDAKPRFEIPTYKPAAQIVQEDLSLRPVSVGFFYPSGKSEELEKAKSKFSDVIKKHKLKFRLQPVFEQEYDCKNINYMKMIELCKTNKLKILIVLGPSPDSEISNEDFYSSLIPLADSENISIQYLPWHELDKDYRYLNLALDITLSTGRF